MKSLVAIVLVAMIASCGRSYTPDSEFEENEPVSDSSMNIIAPVEDTSTLVPLDADSLRVDTNELNR